MARTKPKRITGLTDRQAELLAAALLATGVPEDEERRALLEAVTGDFAPDPVSAAVEPKLGPDYGKGSPAYDPDAPADAVGPADDPFSMAEGFVPADVPSTEE